jgi:hypothetical protein
VPHNVELRLEVKPVREQVDDLHQVQNPCLIFWPKIG